MSEVHRITVQVQAPERGDPGQVTFGYYKVTKRVLIMTDGEGTPIRRLTGEHYKHKLGPRDNPVAIAGMLTKQIRRSTHGGSDFNRQLRYPRSGIA